MTVVQITTTPIFSDDATFRAWGLGVSDAIVACGMVRTADTGQINWATVTRPAVANTAAGYDIVRFNDAAQSTLPLFVKVEYGIGSSVSIPSYWFSIGTGSDNAGNLTGLRMGRTQITRSSSGTPSSSWLSSGDGYFTGLVAGSTPTVAASLAWAIERLRMPDGSVDTSGAASGGFMFCSFSNNPVLNAYTYDGSGSDAPGVTSTQWPALVPSGVGTVTSSGGYKGVNYGYPIYPVLGYPRGPSRAAIANFLADAAAGSSYTISLYGVAHVFRSLGVGMSAAFRNSNITFSVRAE